MSLCARCGTDNLPTNAFCERCGAVLGSSPEANPTASAPPPARPAGAAQGDAVATIIPYRNTPALVGYYLAIFSLVCWGLLSIPAVILGIVGLRKAAADPTAKGKVHAWVAIVLGGLTLLGALVFLGLTLFAAAQAPR